MPFLDKESIPTEARLRGERAYKEALRKRLQDLFLDAVTRDRLRRELTRLTSLPEPPANEGPQKTTGQKLLPGFYLKEDGTQGLACQVCGEVDPQMFMVHNDLWRQVSPALPSGRRSFVCISCFEGHLGRKLTPEDLTRAPVNKGVTLRGVSDTKPR